MARRGRKRAFFKVRLRLETITSLGSLLCFASAGLIALSFSGQGASLQAVNEVIRESFGLASLLIPFLLISVGMVLTNAKWSFAKPQVLLGTFLFFLSFMTLAQTGMVGEALFSNFAALIQPLGTRFVFSLVGLAGFMIFTDTSLKELFSFIASFVEIAPPSPEVKVAGALAGKGDDHGKDQGFAIKGIKLGQETPSNEKPALATDTAAAKSDEFALSASAGAAATDTQAPLANDAGVQVWEYPPLGLLSSERGAAADRGDIKKNADIIEASLASFGINSKVKEVNCGPAVTQYAIDVAAGTKLTKITALANDLALALAAPTGQIRIEAPIPGRSLVGIEVPNHTLQVVTLRTMLTSPAMKRERSKLAVALGLNVGGEPVIADIAKMPHALIAGSTGSGKSVSVNAFIASILFRSSPQEVKFIMVDPKRVELTQYNDIPHLLSPVITEPKKVVNALQWACREMEKRYKLFAEVGVRNIAAYNEMAGFQAIPYIVIVIDELADIMLFSPSEVEESITRLAQMARAVGIHLLLATQRPSVDVITGLIKANIPTRLAFNVSSNTDSRVILDTTGAEKLLGRGDMLFIPPDQAKPVRIQGTFVSDQEIGGLIQFLRQQGAQPEYETDITNKVTNTQSTEGGGEEGTDELFLEALKYVLDSDKGSASHLQRRFSLGYNRAARILDQMEKMGIVSPPQGSKPREVNRTAAQTYLSQHAASEA